jgi:alcohol dehydrogenase
MNATINVPESFAFSSPTRVVFRVGAAEGVADEARVLGGTRALVVSEAGVIKAGIAEPILERLGEAGLQPELFDGFGPNPKDYECLEAVKAAQKHGADVLVGVGGGSSMDMAKIIGLLQTSGGHPVDYAGIGLVQKPLPPVIAIPTTSGTGSEVTACAVCTDTNARVKVNIISPQLAPAVALLDPALTCTVPSSVTAATGMDAFCHAFESYTCTVANPITEGLALYSIELVGRFLKRAVEDGSDLEARTGMQFASTLAGVAFGNSDCLAAHCMAESLGGMVEMPHGVACAIFLPPVFEFNMSADPSKHARAGEALGLDLHGLTADEGAAKTLGHIRQWSRELGIPRLRDIPGVDPGEFGHAAQGAMENVAAGSQPRPTSLEDYMRLFQAAYDEV